MFAMSSRLGWGTLLLLIRADDGLQHPQELGAFIGVQRSDEAAGHQVCPRDQLVHSAQTFRCQSDLLAPAVACVALRCDEAPATKPRHDLGHGRSVERDALTERALVELWLLIESVQCGELRGCDGVRNLLIPQ